MIIRQTTTIIFEYPQDYLQEQEWCKTKTDEWIHVETDTRCSIYENKISYSIGQPNNSEKPNSCDTCRFELYCPEMCEGCCEWDSHYEPKDEPTISKMEQVDESTGYNLSPVEDESQTADVYTWDGKVGEIEIHNILYEPTYNEDDGSM